MVQRVGESKTDVVPQAQPNNPHLLNAFASGQNELTTAVQQADASRKQAKDDHWARISGGGEAPPEGITTAYAAGLSTNRFQDFLPRHDYFQQDTAQDGWRLKANWLPGAVAFPAPMVVSKEVELSLPRGQGRQPRPAVYEFPLATLQPRNYQPLPNQPAEAVRNVFSGGANAKEYVEDMLGVKTRRYAYVEKNYFQMMEFLATNHMEGRFQSLVRAKGGNARPDVRALGDKDTVGRHQLPDPHGQVAPQLTDTQLAFVHQYLGSGDHQRGLSLTSTPRKGETIGNAGDNFRSGGGFRIKIDLARIPVGVAAPILLNHYAAGGIKDQLAGPANDVNPMVGNPAVGRGYAYKYKESVTKNRELYLEFLKPEYVVEIEYHPTADVTATDGSVFGRAGAGGALSQEEMLAAARRVSGHDKYVRGFDVGLEGKPEASEASPEWKKGWAGGHEYHLAYEAADSRKGRSGKKNRDSFGDNPELAEKDEHTFSRLARIHALSRRKKITSFTQLGTQAPALK